MYKAQIVESLGNLSILGTLLVEMKSPFLFLGLSWKLITGKDATGRVNMRRWKERSYRRSCEKEVEYRSDWDTEPSQFDPKKLSRRDITASPSTLREGIPSQLPGVLLRYNPVGAATGPCR